MRGASLWRIGVRDVAAAAVVLAVLTLQALAAPPGLHAGVVMAEVQQGMPGWRADIFEVGQAAGGLVVWRPVPSFYRLVRVWAGLAGRQGTPAVLPVRFLIGPEHERAVALNTPTGAPTRTYEFALAVPTPGGRTIPVASRKFQVATGLGAGVPLDNPRPGGPAQPQVTDRGSGLTRIANGVYVARVVPLRPVSIPEGSLAIPEGWTVRPTQGIEGVYVAPRGHTDPEIYFLPAIAVSDLRYNAILARCTQQYIRNPLFAPDTFTACVAPAVRQQIVDSSHPWSASATVQLILELLARGGARLGAPRITPRSQTGAAYEVAALASGQQVVNWGYVTMVYMPNLLLASRLANPGITSLAFFAGCEAPTDQAASFRPVCASVQSSVRPSPQWLSALVRERMRTYQEEFNALVHMGQTMIANFGLREDMIARFGQSMQQMQYQMFQSQQQANLRIGQDWIAALGGNVRVQDPNTGKIMTVPYRDLPFRSPGYCLTNTGDTVLISERSNLAPGKSAGPYTCMTMLSARF